MLDFRRKFISLFISVGKQYNQIHGPILAKGLAFSLILGILPFFFLLLSLSAYFYHKTSQFRDFLLENMNLYLPTELVTLYASQLVKFSDHWKSISTFTIVVFILFTIAIFDSIERVLSTALNARRRKLISKYAVSLSIIIGTMILFYLLTTTNTMLHYFKNYFNFSNPIFMFSGFVVSCLVLSAILLLLYYVFARRHLRLWPTISTALIFSIIWKLIVMTGSILIKNIGKRFFIFGAMTSGILLLVYLRILAEILIFSCLAINHINPAREINTDH